VFIFAISSVNAQHYTIPDTSLLFCDYPAQQNKQYSSNISDRQCYSVIWEYATFKQSNLSNLPFHGVTQWM